MSFKDYSTTPASNTALGDGTYIGANMLRNKVRPALQQLAADGRDLYDEVLGIALTASTATPLLSVPGAVGDGVADDTVAVQAAINASAAQGRTLVLPKTIKFGAVTVPAGASISGGSSKTVVTALAGNYDTFTITGSDVSIENLTCNEAAKTGGTTIREACGTSTLNRLRYENILTYDSFGFLGQSGSGDGVVISQWITEVQALRLRGVGIAATRLFGHGFWTRVTMEAVGSASANNTAFSVNGTALIGVLGGAAGGLTLNDCNAAGTAGAAGVSGQHGFDFVDFSDISIPLARADTMGGDGFRWTRCDNAEVGKALAQACDGHGHVIDTVTNSDMELLRARGRNALSGSASKDAVRIVGGCYGLNIGRVFGRDMTGHALDVVATQGGAIDIGRVTGFSNTGRSIYTRGTTAVNIGGGQQAGAGAGNLDLGGTLHFVDNFQINAGTKASYGPGPVTA